MANPRIIDSTRQSMGWQNPFQTRRAQDIARIGIHHTATGAVSRAVLENHWRSLGWRNGGYSEIIHPSGDVELCYVPEVVSNGATGTNHNTYHISMMGNGNFTPAQMASLESRVRHNMSRFNVPAASVLAHRELPGQATLCVPMDMDAFRNRLRTPAAPPAGGATHRVVANDTLWGIAQRFGVTVAQLQSWNSLGGSTTIHPGQTLRVSATRTHTVVANDTLWGLSQRFGVTVAAIQSANGMGTSTLLRPGQVLRIPA